MTVNMPDSIEVANLPAGYRAYLGYADGRWPTVPELRTKFPAAHIIGLTVTGATLAADGCDIETGDLTPASGAHWARNKLAEHPGSRPVLYASTSVMPQLLTELAYWAVQRHTVRLLSAHYWDPAGGSNYRSHICPDQCGYPDVPAMDGTQWTDRHPGNSGTQIDMSVTLDTFFDPAPAHPKETDTMRLPPAPGDWGPTTQTFYDYQNRIIIIGPNGGNAIYVTISADNGKTWSTPVRV